MRQLKLFRWAAALTLAIALAPAAASAHEDDTLTISGTFYMDWLDGVGADLAEVFANGHEHTWTLTLYGTTQTHSTYSGWFNISRITEVHATSFDLEFFGPDAATLNGIVRDHMAGAEVWIYLQNSYSSGFGDNFARMFIDTFGGDVSFSVDIDWGSFTLFPSDVDGYPVVGPEPFSIWVEESLLWDRRPGNDGYIWSRESLVTFEGSVGGPEPVVLAAEDVSILEGDHGFGTVAVVVTLTNASSQAITVQYQTVNGTAVAPQDYTAKSGTLTFQPGQTSRTISVSIKGDRKREPDETFSVRLSNAAGATIGSATVTILNDD